MRGDIASFKQRIGQTIKKTLKEYRPEIEIALGPAKVTIRPVKVQNQELQEDYEQEL